MKRIISAVAATLTIATASHVHAQAPSADLVVSVVAASTSQALPDQQIAVDCDVLNQGSAAAGTSRLKYYFSSDSVLDAGDQYLN
ncbi:MAG: CARDB domain-containing protein, partial [Polyangiaceae bacterium]